MTIAFLRNGPEDAPARFVLAHGAGAPMDTAFMNAFAEGLGARGFAVVRFEFAYMAARRESGSRRPPPRAERLRDEFLEVLDALRESRPLVIGGKSLGGRVASLIAQQQYEAGDAAGLVCLGYPFHPPGKPDTLRTAHLMNLSLPSLIVQGTRDPFGGAEEVPGYGLPENIALRWVEDGDHDLVPRKMSGGTRDGNWRDALDAIASWARRAGFR